MEKRTKIILSVVGACAVIIPVLLLITLSSRSSNMPGVSSEKRNIDTKTVEDVARRSIPVQTPASVPSPSPATGSAQTASPSPVSSPGSQQEASSPSPQAEGAE